MHRLKKISCNLESRIGWIQVNSWLSHVVILKLILDLHLEVVVRWANLVHLEATVGSWTMRIVVFKFGLHWAEIWFRPNFVTSVDLKYFETNCRSSLNCTWVSHNLPLLLAEAYLCGALRMVSLQRLSHNVKSESVICASASRLTIFRFVSFSGSP